MTTTHASTHAPKPAEAASRPAQQGNPARAQADKPAEADLFASLLSLVSDTHAAPTTALPDAEATQDAPADTDDKTENPLMALLAWATPAAAATNAASATGAAGSTTSPASGTAAATAVASEGTQKDTGLDITGMTRVDEAAPALPNAATQARAAAASRPAFSPLNPNAATPAPRAADGNGASGGAPAMVWQRGAVSGTEALQQQHSAQFAQVRATVALNERLGIATDTTESVATPASPREFALAGPSGSPATMQDGSLTAATGAAGGDTAGSGDTSSNTSADPGNGDGQPHADASAETDGPTVSHWGTQHLRHASLRVGGEGGADAIDIQLAVKGQEVQVAFQTDNAEARATLRENAGASLAELMQRSGIQLGGVSVGSQGQPQGDGSHHARAAGLSTEALGRTARAAEPANRPAMAPRTDGSRPLDVFA